MKAWMSSNFGKFETELLPLINVRMSFYAPNFEKVGSILVSACAFVRSSGCPFVRSKQNSS